MREKLFRLLGEELPYAAAVEIEQFEDAGRLRRIHAAILVDKPGQKAIVIGKGGEKLKDIATPGAPGHGEAVRRQGVPGSVGASASAAGWTIRRLRRLGYE